MLTDKDLDALLMALRNATPIARLNLQECRAVFRFVESQGYRITPPIAEQPDQASA